MMSFIVRLPLGHVPSGYEFKDRVWGNGTYSKIGTTTDGERCELNYTRREI